MYINNKLLQIKRKHKAMNESIGLFILKAKILIIYTSYMHTYNIDL